MRACVRETEIIWYIQRGTYYTSWIKLHVIKTTHTLGQKQTPNILKITTLERHLSQSESGNDNKVLFLALLGNAMT